MPLRKRAEHFLGYRSWKVRFVKHDQEKRLCPNTSCDVKGGTKQNKVEVDNLEIGLSGDFRHVCETYGL